MSLAARTSLAPRILWQLCTLAGLLCPAALGQGHVFVDPVNGSDSASGSSELEAFQSITHALATTPHATEVRVLPGVCSAATGEVFPLGLYAGRRVFGLAGAGSTVIQPPMDQAPTFQMGGNTFLTDVTLELQGAAHGIHGASPVVQRVEVHGGAVGVRTTANPQVLDCELVGQSQAGLHFQHGEPRVERTRVLSGGGYGVRYENSYSDSGIQMVVDRCWIQDNAGAGILFTFLHFNPEGDLLLRNSLVTGNGEGVIGGDDAELHLEGSTVAYNGGDGVRGRRVVLRGSILASNGGADWGDAGQSFVAELEHSLVQDGSGASSPTKLVGDPRFEQPGVRLALAGDSPCLDVLPVEPGAVDLQGRARVIDGDLDRIGAGDLGALEHRTLDGPAAVPLGKGMQLTVSGQAGGSSTLFFHPQGLAAQPLGTALGRFHLPLPGLRRVATVTTLGSDRAVVAMPPLFDPALVGTSVAFQAATLSSMAPAGAAYSNPLTVLIQ